MGKKIALLGSTGSIGTQALDVIRAQGYLVVALTAQRNIDLLEKQVREFLPLYVGVADEEAADKLTERLRNMPQTSRVFAGKTAAAQIAAVCEADILLNAIVGIAGLSATLAAAQAGIDIALANKESLVTGGYLVTKAVQKNHIKLLPVDSEHSAIFQCLQDAVSVPTLQKILLTASGGPFYGWKKSELATVTKDQALQHPNWSMGAKITIDSATLMNKGLELIEAMWLFDMPAEKIEIVVQRESIIHSMVEFADGSLLAQLGVPDMRLPIQYALTWPQRVPGPIPRLDFSKISTLHFGQPDEETFRCLAACRKAADIGGLAPCAVNGANEAAVALFLEEKIPLLAIGELVEGVLKKDHYQGEYDLQDVYECDKMAREYVLDRVERK